MNLSEPVVFLSLYLRKHLLPDEPAAVFRQIDSFVETFNLVHRGSEDHVSRATDIDLVKLAESPPDFRVLLEAHTKYPEPRLGTFYECTGYIYHDALIFQIMITKFEDWTGSFHDSWRELTTELRTSFNANALKSAGRGALGVSLVYWAIAKDEVSVEVQQKEFLSIAGNRDMRRTATDLGSPLWFCSNPFFSEAPEVSQDLWFLVTDASAEPHVNERFNQPRLNSPAHFPIVALARHKIAYEYDQYRKETRAMEQAREGDVNVRVRALVGLQRHLGHEVEELRTKNAVGFQRKLAEAGAALADYGESLGRLKELRRTVLINYRNFVINSVAVVSAHGAHLVSRSIEQDNAAARFLADWSEDEIFARELSRLQGFCRQIDSDIDYATSLIERHRAFLSHSSEQLRIAGERELGEIAHHLSIDSAAVVASLVGLIVMETVKPQEAQAESAIARWSLALGLIIGSFALTQILSSGGRGTLLERWSAAIALGLLGCFAATRYFTTEQWRPLAGPVGIIAGVILVSIIHYFVKRFRTLRSKKTDGNLSY
jgi:hypothetical protein